MKQKAFTLAEIIIVLSIIGILTGILLPTAFKNGPKEEIMKFKKAHEVLHNAVGELIKSDQYYMNGDLGKKPNGSSVAVKYFCQTFANTLSTKSVNCLDTNNNGYQDQHACSDWGMESMKAKVDENCDKHAAAMMNEIITTDNVHWYEPSPALTFDMFPYAEKDASGFLRCYRTFCIDIDGADATPPFGYGIRRDGKILPGARADEWITKSVRDEI